VFLCERKKLIQDTSLPHLLLLFLAPSIPTLLVGRSVITQAPSGSSSSNNNTNNSSNNSNNNTTLVAKETQELKVKKNLSFSTLSDRKEIF
jgi:hypothetical protein